MPFPSTIDKEDDSSLTSTYEHFDPIDEDHPEIQDTSDKRPLLRDDSQSSTDTMKNGHTEHKYEDFASKLTLQCPTCQGKGKLTQGQADSMVALIPVRDKRLKPRKTKLYLGVTFAISMVITFLVTFFLLPRSVTMEITNLESKTIFIPEDLKSVPYIDVAVTFTIKNENFFKAEISDIGQDISWNRFVLNVSISDVQKTFSVDGRTKMNHTIISKQMFQGDVNLKVKRVCAYGWNWSLLEMFVNTATVSYLSRSEQISNTYYGYIGCHNSSLYMKR